MISRQDAKYVIQQIRNIKFYAEKVNEFDRKIAEIDIKILSVTEPKSPLISDEPKGTNKIPADTRWNALIDQKTEIEVIREPWAYKLNKARGYYEMLLKSDEMGYVEDFFSGRLNMRGLERKYHYSNAYTTIIRIIRNNIEVL